MNSYFLKVLSNIHSCSDIIKCQKYTQNTYKKNLVIQQRITLLNCDISSLEDKKHDKVTRCNTWCIFVMNIASKNNFANYPRLLPIIHRMQASYKEVAEQLWNASNQVYMRMNSSSLGWFFNCMIKLWRQNLRMCQMSYGRGRRTIL